MSGRRAPRRWRTSIACGFHTWRCFGAASSRCGGWFSMPPSPAPNVPVKSVNGVGNPFALPASALFALRYLK